MYNDQNTRQETVQIPLGRLHQCPHHPYKVEDNEETATGSWWPTTWATASPI